jgi:hypothetical protein
MAVIPEHEVPDKWIEECGAWPDGTNIQPYPDTATALNFTAASLDAYRAADPPPPEPPEVGDAEQRLIEWSENTEGLGDGHRSVKIEPTGDSDHPWRLWLSETAEGGEDHCDWTTREWLVYGTSLEDVAVAAASPLPSSPPAGWEETP